jgi:multiple antibiotic resistance protein
MHRELQAIVTLLALVNPVVCALIFMQVEAGRTRRTMWLDASRAVAAVGVILALAALVGARILHLFGVSLDAFSVAGGGVLAWIGFSMLRGGPAQGVDTREQTRSSALTPLVLFAASPGTITGVITIAVAHSRLALPVTALVAVGTATVALGLVIGLSIQAADTARSNGSSAKGGGFVHETVTRFMGLIVIAMGVQFALTGLRTFMQA